MAQQHCDTAKFTQLGTWLAIEHILPVTPTMCLKRTLGVLSKINNDRHLQIWSPWQNYDMKWKDCWARYSSKVKIGQLAGKQCTHELWLRWLHIPRLRFNESVLAKFEPQVRHMVTPPCWRWSCLIKSRNRHVQLLCFHSHAHSTPWRAHRQVLRIRIKNYWYVHHPLAGWPHAKIRRYLHNSPLELSLYLSIAIEVSKSRVQQQHRQKRIGLWGLYTLFQKAGTAVEVVMGAIGSESYRR